MNEKQASEIVDRLLIAGLVPAIEWNPQTGFTIKVEYKGTVKVITEGRYCLNPFEALEN